MKIQDNNGFLSQVREITKLENKYWIKNIEAKRSEIAGNGVFAIDDIPAGTLIEFSPVLVYHKNTTEVLLDVYEKHILCDYQFRWKEDLSALIFGYGEIYNHSNDPSVGYTMMTDENEIQGAVFFTLKPVKAGEELFAAYSNGDVVFDEFGNRYKRKAE